MKKTGMTLLALSLAACGSETVFDQPAPSDERQIATYDRAAADLPIIDWVERERAAGKTLEFTNVLDSIGVDFIKLALQIGTLDANFVDAYSGPEIWRTELEGKDIDADEIAIEVAALQARLDGLRLRDESQVHRMMQLSKQVRAMATRLDVVRGKSVSFDTEVSSIYDVEPPAYDLSVYESVLAEIDLLLPGEGSTADRVDAFRKSLAIPEDKLKIVFDRAIKECRDRTMQHYDLPADEKFTMEFVTDKSWSGYNYYQGNFESLIQINTDFPIIIDRAVDLGCHEGYPGHHVWNLFVEREIIGKRGWIEYSVQPLFGPFGPIAEGTGNYGIELAFPGDDKIDFERDVLFPLAGLDPSHADKLSKLNGLQAKLSHARNEISRRYLDGNLTREQALPMLQKYLLASPERTEQSLKFVETYRGYVINYNIGRDLAAAYVEAAGDDPEARWAAFRDMLTRPMTASDIVAELE